MRLIPILAAAAGLAIGLMTSCDVAAEEAPDPIAIWENPNGLEQVYFFATQGECPSGSLIAVHADLQARVITGGCYQLAEPHVIIFTKMATPAAFSSPTSDLSERNPRSD